VTLCALAHAPSEKTVVVAVQAAVAAPQKHGVQLRVSTGLPENVCWSPKPAGQGKSPSIQTHAPGTNGDAGVGAQTSPALHPVAAGPPLHASPARPQSGGGRVLPPPPGEHAPAIAVGALAEYAFVPVGGAMGPHWPGAGWTAVPPAFAQPALVLKSRVAGVQLTDGVEQVQAPQSAGWAIKSPLPVKALVGSDAGHDGTIVGSPS
jgi:hypothetical protein